MARFQPISTQQRCTPLRSIIQIPPPEDQGQTYQIYRHHSIHGSGSDSNNASRDIQHRVVWQCNLKHTSKNPYEAHIYQRPFWRHSRAQIERPDRAHYRTDGRHGGKDTLDKRLRGTKAVLVGLDTQEAGHGRYVEADGGAAWIDFVTFRYAS
jgi:hypothetical protein